MLLDLQKVRTAMANRVGAVERDGLPEEWAAPARAVVEELERVEKGLNRYLEQQARRHFMAAWVKQQKGIGLPGFARLVGITGPLDRYATVSKLWRYLGLAVIGGEAERKQKGVKLSYSPQGKVLCVRPDQRVTTRRGEIPIADIVVGDVVLTHRGNWKPVTAVYLNEHNGELVRPRAVGRATAGPWLTGNHPVYTRQKTIYRWTQPDGRERWRMANHHRSANYAVASRVRTMVAAGARQREVARQLGVSEAAVSFYVNGRLSEPPYETGWIGASGLLTGWEVFSPIVPAEPRLVELVLSRTSAIEREGKLYATGAYQGRAHPRAHGVPVAVTVDRQIARLIGLYLAEGHVSGNHVGWSFHEDETTYIDEVRATLLERFNLPSSLCRNRPNHATQVICCSKILAETLTSFGKGSYDKAPPPSWLWELDDAVLAALLDGIFDGDGHLLSNGRRDLGTVSDALARFVEQAGRRLGRPMSRYTNRRGVYRVLELERPDGRDEVGSWHAVKTLDRASYAGPVYNLEVEDDHSYVVDGVAVHNCYQIGESIVKMGKGGEYRRVYDDKRAEYFGRERTGPSGCPTGRVHKTKTGAIVACVKADESGKETSAHIHAMARRFAVKRLLRRAWTEWRRMQREAADAP